MPKPLPDMSHEELWQLFPILLAKHDPAWAERYDAEAARIAAALGADRIVRITHIGSTSVTRLTAKPTIDILLEVGEDTDTAALDRAMEDAGYRCNPKPGNPAPHRMYLKGYTPEGFQGQVFHVHVRYPGDWDELYFWDWLRTHPEVADAYAALKEELRRTFEHDRDAYTEAKTGFIRRETARARAEYGPRYRPAGTDPAHPQSGEVKGDDHGKPVSV